MASPIGANKAAPTPAPFALVPQKTPPGPEVPAPTARPAPAPIPAPIRLERARFEILMERTSVRWKVIWLPRLQVKVSASTAVSLQEVDLDAVVIWRVVPAGRASTCCQLELSEAASAEAQNNPTQRTAYSAEHLTRKGLTSSTDARGYRTAAWLAIEFFDWPCAEAYLESAAAGEGKENVRAAAEPGLPRVWDENTHRILGTAVRITR